MYAFVEKKKDNEIVIFKIDEQKKAIQTLKDNGISLVDSEILKNL